VTSLKGKVAIITGAGRGIGRAIAVKLARCEADVVLVDLELPVESAALASPSGDRVRWGRI
jgi:NAD(P)-dependent dehydrogenase (short-subunit alcohol dehydrogenase family)